MHFFNTIDNGQSSKRRVFFTLCSKWNLHYCICLYLLKISYNTHPQRLFVYIKTRLYLKLVNIYGSFWAQSRQAGKQNRPIGEGQRGIYGSLGILIPTMPFAKLQQHRNTSNIIWHVRYERKYPKSNIPNLITTKH